MLSPDELASSHPLSAPGRAALERNRAAVLEVLGGGEPPRASDAAPARGSLPAAPRMLAVVGPCSIHDEEEALEYGRGLLALQAELAGSFLLVMRAYVEKSRSALGWRGLAEEPELDGRRDPEGGVLAARRILLCLAELGLPLGVEIVSPYLWRYWEDLLSWTALGARGVESQALRETAALLPLPCAFKHPVDGRLEAAANAALVASRPLRLLGPGRDGRMAVLEGGGNPLPQLCLRGSLAEPNAEAAGQASALLRERGLAPAILLDLGHDNSGAPPEALFESALAAAGTDLRGVMIESNLEAGAQAPGPRPGLRRGVSITDPCLSLEETGSLLKRLAARLR